MTSRSTGNASGARDVIPPVPHPPPPPAGGGAPGGNGSGPHRRTIRVVNPLGLHWRVAERFSRAAKAFACVVRVFNGDTRADGKSPTDLILLVALPGAELILEVDGSDAATALEPLAEILAAPGGEDYTI